MIHNLAVHTAKFMSIGYHVQHMMRLLDLHSRQVRETTVERNMRTSKPSLSARRGKEVLICFYLITCLIILASEEREYNESQCTICHNFEMDTQSCCTGRVPGQGGLGTLAGKGYLVECNLFFRDETRPVMSILDECSQMSHLREREIMSKY